jgi:inositol phosphorylceramide mannosyltransferase catalytic subunit
MDDLFFEKCIVESSGFDIEYAKSNSKWRLLESLFNNDTTTNSPIPKIFHFIWLGGKLPKMYEDNIADWKSKNQDFEVKIWDDNSSDSIVKKYNKYDLFKSAKNFGVKSDILRYVILHEFGGIYVDTDFICLSSKFCEVVDSCSFFAGVMLDKDPVIGNSIIGASKQNKIILNCLEKCSDQTHKHIQCYATRTLYQTGPFLLTECVFSNMDNGIKIFPTKTFFAFPAIHRNIATPDLVKKYLIEDSLACHLWHCSWQQDSRFYVGENNA